MPDLSGSVSETSSKILLKRDLMGGMTSAQVAGSQGATDGTFAAVE
jgi:hypothetical protein